jgi:hypothetical protein
MAVRIIISTLRSIDIFTTPASIDQIREMNRKLKIKCLGYNKISNQLKSDAVELLQTYNLIPTLKNSSLSQIFSILFAVSDNSVNIDNLELKLRIIGKEQSKHIAFVIIAKDNNDFYFDIANLFDSDQLAKINSAGGISENYIDSFKILQTNIIAQRCKKIVIPYNYNDPDEIYILWTNDLSNFKIRTTPISKEIADRIIRGRPSDIISLRNSKFEQIILDKISDNNLISFKQVKYLSFDTDNEEKIFINSLCAELSKYLKSNLKSNNSVNTMTEDINTIFQNEFKSFKPFHSSKKVLLQPIMIYMNATIQLTNRIKKEISEWVNKNEPVDKIDSLIKMIVDSNDNIYTKFISSYYLAMSGSK